MSEVTLIVKDRRGTKLGDLKVNLASEESTVYMLKKQVSKIKRIAPIRQWLTIGEDDKKIVLDDNHRLLKTYSEIKNGAEITVKDLGIQLSWRTVFYAEYVGPIAIYLGIYLLAAAFNKNLNQSQMIGLFLGVAHYVKRVLETLFVHIFSRDSMPLASCWKNFLHYWIFFAAFIGTEYFFFYTDPQYTELTKSIWIGLWCVSEFLNFMCHHHLSTLRSDSSVKLEDGSSGNKKRQIPHGWGFDQVSCANYLWETCSWIAFSGFSRCYTSYFFTAVSFYQMFVWALGKQRRYKKEFGKEFPRGRKAIIPFII